MSTMTTLEHLFIVLLIVSMLSGTMAILCVLDWLITKIYPKWRD